MGIGTVHTSTHKHVYIGVSAEAEALLPALDEAVSKGLPLRVCSGSWDLALHDLRRVQAFAQGYLPRWRWVWELPIGTNRSADLVHLDPDLAVG